MKTRCLCARGTAGTKARPDVIATLLVSVVFIAGTFWFLVTLPIYVAPFILSLWVPQFPPFSIGAALVAGLVLNLLPTLLFVVPYPRRVFVGSREIVVTCGWPIVGRVRRFPLAEFDGVKADPQFFAVLRKDASFLRRHFFLASQLESHAEARWLASEVEKAVRRNVARG